MVGGSTVDNNVSLSVIVVSVKGPAIKVGGSAVDNNVSLSVIVVSVKGLAIKMGGAAPLIIMCHCLLLWSLSKAWPSWWGGQRR